MPSTLNLQIKYPVSRQPQVEQFRRAARARGLSLSDYLCKLVELHQTVIKWDDPDGMLRKLGLGPVSL